MASFTRWHLPAVFLVLIGVGTVSFAGAQVLGLTESEYSYTVAEIDRSDVPEDTTVRPIGEFSPTTREAFRAARESPDDHYTGTTEAADLTYGSDAVGPDSEYYVRAGSGTYRFVAMTGGGGLGTAYALQFYLGVVAPAGLVAVVAGGAAFAFDRPNYPAALLVGIVVAAVPVVGPDAIPASRGWIAVAPLAAAATWGTLTCLDDRSAPERDAAP